MVIQCARTGVVDFPKPGGISVNMMPFIMGDNSSIPGSGSVSALFGKDVCSGGGG